MPIYEFYCQRCNTLFNFFSKTVNTTKTPLCPKCGDHPLSRRMSAFAVTGKAREDNDMDDLPFDEGKMERAMQMLAGEAENIREDDPRRFGYTRSKKDAFIAGDVERNELDMEEEIELGIDDDSDGD